MGANKFMSSTTDPRLLEKIDKLRDRNINHQIPLPQLVVVGDQSAGKSSLLESITGIPFPKGEFLVTRHATQISSRKSNKSSVAVSILPGPRASDQHRVQLETFKRTLHSTSELAEQFKELFTAAGERMGLRANLHNAETGEVFSSDVLKIEIHGPDQEFLTIIDVPGIFRTRMQGVTKEDMTMVRDLVTSYISDERTVILAVIPCNVQFATSEILELAEAFDPSGERTLAVLTKPDKVTDSVEQRNICELVETGGGRPLLLGYYLVRNRGEDGVPSTQCELDGSLFSTDPWSTLPAERVGIAAVKSVLGGLLHNLTIREYPGLVRDLGRKILTTEGLLASLGEPRQKESDQRKFLSSIVKNFQNLVRDGLAAGYHMDEGFFQPSRRILTHITNFTELFSQELRQNGHVHQFKVIESVPARELSEDDPDDTMPNNPEDTSINRLTAALNGAFVDEPSDRERLELSGVLAEREVLAPPLDDVKEWIEMVYYQSRGPHLGTFDPKLISLYFTEQSRKWGTLSMMYLSRVILALHRFMHAALADACSDAQVRAHIWTAILPSLGERYRAAIDMAKLLVDIERQGTPYTVNASYDANCTRLEKLRHVDDMRRLARLDSRTYEEPQFVVSINAIIENNSSHSSRQMMQDKIHDTLYAYYQVALERFVDNVFKQVVDYGLLNGPSSPLCVLDHNWLHDLDPNDLARIAGESIVTKKRRSQLKKELNNFNGALKDLKD